MRVGIFGPKKLSKCEELLLKEARKVFGKADYIPISQVIIKNEAPYFKNRKLENYDIIIPRVPRTYYKFAYIVLSLIKDKVYMPIRPEAVVLSRNKFLALMILKEAGLPVPESFLAFSRKVLENLIKEMQFPIVLKLLYGSLGRGVMFADSYSSAISVMDTLERFNQPIFIQEFLPHEGFDIRVFVLGNKVLAAEKRIAKEGERRTNIGIGGRGEKIEEVDKEIEEISIKAANVLGMKITGIDVISTEYGNFILEANVNVHFEGLMEVTKINIARKIVEFVKEDSKKEKEKAKLERMIRWLKIRF